MKELRLALAISIVVHFILFLTAGVIKFRAERKREFLEIAFTSSLSAVTPIVKPVPQPVPPPKIMLPKASRPEAPTVSLKKPTTKDTNLVETPSVPETPPKEPSAFEILSGQTDYLRELAARRSRLLRFDAAEIAKSAQDSVSRAEQRLKENFSRMVYTQEDLQQIAPAYDPVANNIYRRNVGHPTLLPLGPLLGQGLKFLSDKLLPQPEEKKKRLTTVPSDLELDILVILWEQGQVSLTQMYPYFTDRYALMAETLANILNAMVAKGLIGQKVIYGKTTSQITTPFGKFGNEDKNRVVIYRPLYEKKEVLTFLNALLYRLNSGSAIAMHMSEPMANPVTGSKDDFRQSLVNKIVKLATK